MALRAVCAKNRRDFTDLIRGKFMAHGREQGAPDARQRPNHTREQRVAGFFVKAGLSDESPTSTRALAALLAHASTGVPASGPAEGNMLLHPPCTGLQTFHSGASGDGAVGPRRVDQR